MAMPPCARPPVRRRPVWGGSRLFRAAPLLPVERLAPARQEDRDERVLLGRIHGQRRQRHRHRERDVIALRAGGDGASIRRVRLVHPPGGLDEAGAGGGPAARGGPRGRAPPPAGGPAAGPAGSLTASAGPPPAAAPGPTP